MNRVWWVFFGFVFGALADLVTTILNLHYLGYSFEGNPLIQGWFGAVLLKVVCVAIVGLVIAWTWRKQTFVGKFSLISILLIAMIGQLIAGGIHLYVFGQYVGNDIVHAENGDIIVVDSQGIVVDQFRPIVNSNEKLAYYFGLVGVFLLYPYLLSVASLKLALWTTKVSIR